MLNPLLAEKIERVLLGLSSLLLCLPKREAVDQERERERDIEFERVYCFVKKVLE